MGSYVNVDNVSSSVFFLFLFLIFDLRTEAKSEVSKYSEESWNSLKGNNKEEKLYKTWLFNISSPRFKIQVATTKQLSICTLGTCPDHLIPRAALILGF